MFNVLIFFRFNDAFLILSRFISDLIELDQ
jgi:hypothetical protein